MSHTPIKFTISGLRGVWGENLTKEVSKMYLTAFFVFLQKRQKTPPDNRENSLENNSTSPQPSPTKERGQNPRIIISRDARLSGPIILEQIKNLGQQAGFDIVDIGISPTPTLIYLLRNLDFDGGIMISASHNPREYNGIKFLTEKGLYVNQTEVDEIASYLGTPLVKGNTLGTYTQDESLIERHVDHIISFVDCEKIAAKKFRIVLDPINSCGYKIGVLLLEKLSVTPIIINGIPNGDFAHIPEPLPENLTKLGETVSLFKAHAGFAMDPDADRLVICDETGTVVFEEYTLSLAIQSVLKKEKSDIVINLSTSNTNEDLAAAFGRRTFRTPVGEMHVAQGIIDHGTTIGGEGGGGVIHKDMNLCRDSLVGIALILELLANEDKTLSQLVAELPKWEFIKTKFLFVGNFQELKERITTLFPTATLDTRDGLRFDFPDRSWVQIRASNTEPIIRIYGEAKDRESIVEKIEAIKKILQFYNNRPNCFSIF